MNNPEENPKPDSVADNVEIQRRFNELRGELLDKRAVSIDRWLSVIAIVLTFFGVVVVVAGYIGFTRFREIETEAKGYVEEIKKNRDISVGYLDSIKTMTAEIVAKNSEKAKQVATKVAETPTASLIDKAIAQAVFLQQQGKRDEAIEKWRAVAHFAEGIDNDQAARAWYSIGYLRQNLEEKILAYDRAISLKPDYADAYYNRGITKSLLKQYDSAIADYDKVIRLRPDHFNAYNARGIAKYLLNRHEEAIADYNEAIRLRPDVSYVYYHRGEAKGMLGQSDSAIADYDEAILLYPNLPDAYYKRGVEKAKLDRIEEARQDFEKARDLAREAGDDSLADLAEQGLRDLGQ